MTCCVSPKNTLLWYELVRTTISTYPINITTIMRQADKRVRVPVRGLKAFSVYSQKSLKMPYNAHKKIDK